MAALGAAIVAAVSFFAIQARSAHPMIPLELFRSREALTPVAIGFTFMIGFYGMVFLLSLFLQQERGLTPFQAGLAFVPVTAFSIFMPMLAARIAERFGAWVPIVVGQAAMALGLFALSAFAASASVYAVIAMMIPVGVGSGVAMPSATSLLLNAVPQHRSGTASGVLNTSRQVGGRSGSRPLGRWSRRWALRRGCRSASRARARS